MANQNSIQDVRDRLTGLLADWGTELSSVLAELEGFEGWAVVEQDRVVRPGETPDAAAATSLRNREFLAGMGLPR